MRIHRFIGQFNLNSDFVDIDDAEVINQIKNVFRMQIGDKIGLSDGAGNEAIAEISKLDKKKITGKITERYANRNLPKNTAALYCAVFKKENFELVIQKAVECGIAEIFPVITERTIKLSLNMERIRKIVKEAAEQSGRGKLPAMHEPIKFEAAVKDVPSNNINILFDEDGKENIFEILSGSASKKNSAWIGPEGGWTENEIETARTAGFRIATLGKGTLRGETAAIIASYLASNL